MNRKHADRNVDDRVALLVLLGCLAVVSRAGAAEEKLRLAILPEDSATESRSVADLMTVELGEQAAVELVDRAEIDRVLAEQQLSAAGLQDTVQRVKMGRLLRADGLVFLGTDRLRKCLLLRVVETRHGYLAGQLANNLKAHTLAEIAHDASGQVARATPKLRLDPAGTLLVSLWRFGDATGLGEPGAVDVEFPLRLIELLSRDPKILLLERRQLGALHDETSVTVDGETDLKVSGIIVDGELAPSPGVPVGRNDTPVTFTVRLRSTELKELARISKQGRLQDLDALFVEAAAAVPGALHAARPEKAASAGQETAALLERHEARHEPWTVEAAYALTPTNPAARDKLINDLVAQATAGRDHYYEFLNEGNARHDRLEQARILARVHRMCVENRLPLTRFFPYHSGLKLSTVLSSRDILLSSEARDLLRPFRSALKHDFEKSGERPERKCAILASYAGAFHDNPLDSMAYTKSLFDQVCAMTNVPAPDRYEVIVSLLNHCAWTPDVVESLTNSMDPVVRFFAYGRALGYQMHGGIREQLTRSAFNDLKYVLEHRADVCGELYWGLGFFPCEQSGPFQPILTSITNVCPDLQAPTRSLLISTINQLTDKGDYRALSAFRPERYFDLAEPASVARWINRISASAPPRTNRNLLGLPPAMIGLYQLIFRLEEIRKEAIEAQHPEARMLTASGISVASRVLLTSDDPRWKQTAGTLWPADKAPVHSNGTGMVPQRLLPDGDTLWIALGGFPLRKGDEYLKKTGTHSTGLMHMDLKTGKILSCRYGLVEGNWLGGGISTMIKWRDHIVFGQGGVGLLLFPADATDQRSDLNGVTIVSVKDGLLSHDVGEVAAIGDSLFVKLSYQQVVTNGPKRAIFHEQDVVMEWNSKTKAVSRIGAASLFAESSEITGLGADGIRKRIQRLVPDPFNRVLNVECSLHRLDGGGSSASGIGRATWAYHMDSNSWTCVSVSTSVPPRVASASAFKALPSYLSRSLEAGPSSGASGVNTGMFFMRVRDANDWQDGTIAISATPIDPRNKPTPGRGRDWRIELFTPNVAGGGEPLAEEKVENAKLILKAMEDEWPPIIEAAGSGDVERMETLIAAGADINTLGRFNVAPLYYAIFKSQPKAALWLLQHGADVNLMSSSRKAAPLQAAVFEEQDEVVKELLARKADVRYRNTEGFSAIFAAAERGRLDLFNLLIRHGADPREISNRGYGLLVYAAGAPRPDVLRELLNKGIGKSEIREAMTQAIWCGRTNSVTLLLEHGADLTSPDRNGALPPLVAARRSPPDMLRFLIRQGISIKGPTEGPFKSIPETEMTPLGIAMLYDNPLNVRILIEAGADVTQVTQYAYRYEETFLSDRGWCHQPWYRLDSTAAYMEGLGNHIRKTFGDQAESANPGK